jgi:virulence factor Mce-like protein
VVHHPVPLLALVILALIVWWAVGTRSHPHHVRAVFSSAISTRKGLKVQYDGLEAGKISNVKYQNGQAIVTLGIDNDYWPLPKGTKATLRFGTTLGNGTRLINLDPGPKSNPPLPENGVIPVKDTSTPVEFDQTFNTFNAPTRENLQGFLRNTRAALDGHAKTLNRDWSSVSPGLDALGSVASDLTRDEHSLRTLISNGNRTTAVLAGKQQQISQLLTVAAQTFDTFAHNTRATQASITEAAPTLSQARTTLARVDSSVGILNDLVDKVRPGAKRLPSFLVDARPAIHQLAILAPQAQRTLATLRHSAPQITSLLHVGTPFLDRARKLGSGLAPQVACVRPYAPEMAAFFANWASFGATYDGTGHLARVHAEAGPTALKFTPKLGDHTTSTFLNLTGNLDSYAMPRPPGYNAGTPWFLPECGAGTRAVDPSQDPWDTYTAKTPSPKNTADDGGYATNADAGTNSMGPADGRAP